MFLKDFQRSTFIFISFTETKTKSRKLMIIWFYVERLKSSLLEFHFQISWRKIWMSLITYMDRFAKRYKTLQRSFNKQNKVSKKQTQLILFHENQLQNGQIKSNSIQNELSQSSFNLLQLIIRTWLMLVRKFMRKINTLLDYSLVKYIDILRMIQFKPWKY